MTWHTSISQSVGPSTIASIEDYVSQAPGSQESPIDLFYRASQDILRVGDPAFLAAHPGMGPLLLVGLVSTTENYFRDLFTRVIRLCPVAKAASADQTVNLGSVIWHGGQDAERGAFEHISFAGAENLTKTSKKFLAYNLRRTQLVDEYDRVCELRHGIVHSSGVLAGKNAIKLQLQPATVPLRIVMGFGQLQECAAICNSLVISVNQEIFFEMARRWSKDWPNNSSWQPTKRNSLFKDIWEIFHSRIDALNNAIASPLSMVRCRNQRWLGIFGHGDKWTDCCTFLLWKEQIRCEDPDETIPRRSKPEWPWRY
jgi:hypothetical protein